LQSASVFAAVTSPAKAGAVKASASATGYSFANPTQFTSLVIRQALARNSACDGGLSMMTKVRGGSNPKAKRKLGWPPNYSSWRRGFVEGIG
jgi:hypothetical protein